MDPLTIALGAKLIGMVPSLFKLFGEDNPPSIINKVVDIAQSITGETNPEAAVKRLEIDPMLAEQFRAAAENRSAEMIKLFLNDMQSARQRDEAIQRFRGSNKRADALVLLSIATVVLCLFIVAWMYDLNEFAKATITLICGRALGWVEQVFSFEFGTTRQSKSKDDTINNLSSTTK